MNELNNDNNKTGKIDFSLNMNNEETLQTDDKQQNDLKTNEEEEKQNNIATDQKEENKDKDIAEEKEKGVEPQQNDDEEQYRGWKPEEIAIDKARIEKQKQAQEAAKL
eukprot:428967_1